VLRADVDEIAKLCADLAAAEFIEPTPWHQVAEAGTDPSCGSPQRDGKDLCGVSGTGTSARGSDGRERRLQSVLGTRWRWSQRIQVRGHQYWEQCPKGRTSAYPVFTMPNAR